MKKLHFVLGIHNHQPAGNFPEVFVEASEKAYIPWIKTMVSHPDIKWNMHLSGILWDWLGEQYPSYIQDVEYLVKRGSLELLTGGYYEPILPIVPDKDKIGQIQKLTTFIEDEFAYTPRGLWLAERVWEPHLPAILSQAGVTYTLLDDRHFIEAGVSPEELNGYVVTEEQGESLYVFSINQKLRYLVPFAAPEETIEYLRAQAVENGDAVVVLADDGEKFGMWPGTYKHVYTDGWLARFIALLQENAEWLITSTFSDILRKFPPKSRLYLPCASYIEMSEWSLPVKTASDFYAMQEKIKSMPEKDEILRFVKGGFWRNFLVRYPESNNMHKKMLLVSKKIHEAFEKEKNMPNIRQLKNAREHLWAGQCNCAYWHGIFGGIYLPHLRDAVYKNLITAEQLVKNGSPGYVHSVMDFKKMGRQEVLFSGDAQNLYFAPYDGGSLFEWDLYTRHVNVINVISRRREIYHDKILQNNVACMHEDAAAPQTIHEKITVKEKGLEKYLNYDWYTKTCFLDHFLHPSASYNDFAVNKFGEQGDFILGEYKWKIIEGNDNCVMTLTREGHVWVDDMHHPIQVKKKFNYLDKAGITAEYMIKNAGEKSAALWFGYELNISFSEENASDASQEEMITAWERIDKWKKFKFILEFAQACSLWTHPIYTVSSAEDGIEKTYQGVTILPNWKVFLHPGESYALSTHIKILDEI
ncbi:MAG: alpha-amylase/4-alpha-glucanotransferase domain-containing protein [bacterium]